MKPLFTSLFFSLPGRYARALLQSSRDPLHESFNVVLSVLNHDPTSQLLINSSFLNKKPVLKFVDTLAQKLSFNQMFTNFLKLLVLKNRLIILSDIFRCYKTLWDCEHNRKSVKVSTASKMEKEDREFIQKLLKTHFPQKLDFVFDEKPSLLGGVLIETDIHRIDATIQNQIQLLSEHLRSL